MRLIVIGRDPQEASIVINSQYVSNYHAEIILLDNGDMFLVDKSTNGTFLNGMKLIPGKEVAVKRGDNVMFADVPLDWNQVQPIKVPKDVKVIKGIGSHYMNVINVQGPNVSRFHATIRQMADKKWYICDHSKNGTTVNNVRIQKDKFVRIKKGDEIACAGVPIQNPIPNSGISFKWGAMVAAIACLTALIILIPKPWSAEKVARAYTHSVALVITAYHFEVSCPGLNLNKTVLPTEFIYKFDKFSGQEVIVDYRQHGPHIAQGTAFFIGEEGHLATNRHVARPWEYTPATYSDQYSYNLKTIIDYAEAIYRAELMKHYTSKAVIAHISQLEVRGVIDYTFVIPHGSEFDSTNRISCREVIVSQMDEDLAIFKVKNNMIPSNITSVPLDKISSNEMGTAKQIYTIGFPKGLEYQKFTSEPLQAYFSSGQVSTLHSLYDFGVTAMSYHGASGSPVFDKCGNVVGVIHAGREETQGYNYAIKAKYLQSLLNAANITK